MTDRERETLEIAASSIDDQHSKMTLKPFIYICELHGEMFDRVTFWDSNNTIEGEYCIECYKQLIREHCKSVTRKP